MSDQASGKLFAAAGIVRNEKLSSDDYRLIIRQRPLTGRAFAGKEKDRRPVDPLPIIQLCISESADQAQNFLQSPYYFMSCSLVVGDETRQRIGKDEMGHTLAGTLVSSLHRVKDLDNTDGGFFVFSDLSVRIEGIFRLQFTLFEAHETEAACIKSVTSDPFMIYEGKGWPGMAESTALTRSFGDQGIRIRLRKEPRIRLNARGPASDNYEPKRYKVRDRKQSQTDPPPLAQVSQQQQTHQQPHEGVIKHSQAQSDTSGPMQQQQQMTWQSPISLDYSKKRDYSQSALADFYASQGSHGNQDFRKRARTDLENIQQPYNIQQYPQTQDLGSRLYSDPDQATSPHSYSQLSPQHLYGNAYTSSPVSMTPRNQAYFYIPRRGDPPNLSTSSSYDMSSGRQPNNLPQQSPLPAFGYGSASSPIPLSPYGNQQNQYVPQLTQPSPTGRLPVAVESYHAQSDVQQSSMQPRPTGQPTIDVLPPFFGSITMPGTGSSHPGNNQLPTQSAGEDPRYPRTYTYGYKPGDNIRPR